MMPEPEYTPEDAAMPETEEDTIPADTAAPEAAAVERLVPQV